jgi:hypothetical protein
LLSSLAVAALSSPPLQYTTNPDLLRGRTRDTWRTRGYLIDSS